MSKTNGNTNGKDTQVIPSLATPAMAARERAVLAIVTKAIANGVDLDAAAGRLLLAGCTWAGAVMWREHIARQRAALVTIPSGAMQEVWK